MTAPGGRVDRGVAAAADVHYPAAGGARAAAVLAADTSFADVIFERVVVLDEVLPYRSGHFYLRELPPLRTVLAGLPQLRLIVVDGYADLDPCGTPGLGAYLHQQLRIPVIGVAKSFFRTATHAIPVTRGGASRPLYVTSAGLPRAQAAELVRHMRGKFRVPDALRRADALGRMPG
jgi:deoxyribonuclease V